MDSDVGIPASALTDKRLSDGAFRVLAIVAARNGELGAKEVGKMLGMSTPTTQRNIKALDELGYVNRVNSGSKRMKLHVARPMNMITSEHVEVDGQPNHLKYEQVDKSNHLTSDQVDTVEQPNRLTSEQVETDKVIPIKRSNIYNNNITSIKKTSLEEKAIDELTKQTPSLANLVSRLTIKSKQHFVSQVTRWLAMYGPALCESTFCDLAKSLSVNGKTVELTYVLKVLESRKSEWLNNPSTETADQRADEADQQERDYRREFLAQRPGWSEAERERWLEGRRQVRPLQEEKGVGSQKGKREKIGSHR